MRVKITRRELEEIKQMFADHVGVHKSSVWHAAEQRYPDVYPDTMYAVCFAMAWPGPATEGWLEEHVENL